MGVQGLPVSQAFPGLRLYYIDLLRHNTFQCRPSIHRFSSLLCSQSLIDFSVDKTCTHLAFLAPSWQLSFGLHFFFKKKNQNWQPTFKTICHPFPSLWQVTFTEVVVTRLWPGKARDSWVCLEVGWADLINALFGRLFLPQLYGLWYASSILPPPIIPCHFRKFWVNA